jgi:hypothetical protein
MDNVEPALRDMISKVSGNRNLGVQTRLFHDLGISGDDAAELLNDVHQKFGTSFAEFPFVDFFSDETEALMAHLARRLGLRSRRKSLTLGHLVKVVEKGTWFEP